MRNVLRLIVLLTVLGMPLVASATGKVYKCPDASGSLTFSNFPCGEGKAAVATAVEAAPAVAAVPAIALPPAEIDRQCQMKAQEISLRYAGQVQSIDERIMQTVAAAGASSDAARAELDTLKQRRSDMDKLRREEHRALAQHCDEQRTESRNVHLANSVAMASP
jgi:hypothetical protein